MKHLKVITLDLTRLEIKNIIKSLTALSEISGGVEKEELIVLMEHFKRVLK